MAQDRDEALKDMMRMIPRSLVLDGSAVHYAGNLQMNVTNFGFLGSMPKSAYAMSESPSAQWPSGSGVEYLYAAGIWIGAELDGVQAVSTGYPETEFYPSGDPIDVIYHAHEGDEGGNRHPGDADDDGDGRVDEDWLNGRDDDGDGLIDEDFEAIGKLMYSCWYTDDQPVARRAWPEHMPFGLQVRQETYQWSEEALNDFVAVHYHITTTGSKILTNLYVGIYADLDAGPLDRPNYFKDDMIGSWEGLWCAKSGGVEIPVRLKIVYVFDKDGDDGRTPGYFGILFLGSQLDSGEGSRPTAGRLNAIRIFAGLLPFERGGEPVNDFQRYSVLSQSARDPNTETMNDYKVLMSTGPFSVLMPGSAIDFDAAFVAGSGLADMLDNAAMAALTYRGIGFDADNNSNTGVNGRETPLVGPMKMVDPDACDGITESIDVKKGETLWFNLDCQEERTLWNFADCYHGSMPFSTVQTGVGGKEARVHWITSQAPPPPHTRVIPGDGNVTLIWDNLSEIVPDQITLQYDFEGYQIWRAEDWHRPLGTNFKTGPSADLWHLLRNVDLVNGIAPDYDFKKPYGQGGLQYRPLATLPSRDALAKYFEECLTYSPLDTVAWPPGLPADVCDTLNALARWKLGLEGGRQYYEFVDWNAKSGLPYFYSVVAYDHVVGAGGKATAVGASDSPISNFVYVVPRSVAQPAANFRESLVYVVPNPVTKESMAPWLLGPTNSDPSGEKLEFRNLPRCVSTVRVYTLAGDLVMTLTHDGSGGDGSLAWNLISRNGQNITSGVYIFSVEPQDRAFARTVGKFVVIR
jgi:hypothetical protein